MVKKFPSNLSCLLIINLLQYLKKKANVFNSFFVKQCSPIPSSSVLPAKISYMTKDRIKTLCFGKGDVIKLIKALDVNKAHVMMEFQLR